MYGPAPRVSRPQTTGFARSSCASILTRVPIEKEEIGRFAELQRHVESRRRTHPRTSCERFQRSRLPEPEQIKVDVWDFYRTLSAFSVQRRRRRKAAPNLQSSRKPPRNAILEKASYRCRIQRLGKRSEVGAEARLPDGRVDIRSPQASAWRSPARREEKQGEHS
jgi:hypothetical protein